LQHLSAMGLDPVGGKAVNLMDGPRQDIYQEVADKVTEQVTADAVWKEFPEAKAWKGRVTRKTVKRGVMTTPYGVTPEGIKRQLIEDRMLEGVPGDTLTNAVYMRDLMVDAIDNTIIKGKEIMAWMQNVAKQLCNESKPVQWVTPTGFVCTQAYRKPNKREYRTLAGKVAILEPNPTGELRSTKQVNSIAPNIVHSFDAAHLMMTINKAEGLGICVGTVHDSYGTHACDVPTLSRILRETFVDIYSEDQLANLKQSFVQSAGRYEDWMEPPVRGDFKIEEVLQSSYFFF
jgi:DNA-directed RNA polymerase